MKISRELTILRLANLVISKYFVYLRIGKNLRGY